MREKIRLQRSALSPEFCNNASRSIAQSVFSLPEFQSAINIATYLTNENEVDTQFIIKEAWHLGKKTFLPVLRKDKRLDFYLYHSNISLKKNQFKIDEPDNKTTRPIEIALLDIVLVPLVGFTEECHRLGRGLGCYDRTFELINHKQPHKPKLIGLAYEMQRTEFIPAEWDVKLDFVVTEENIYPKP